jgi:transcriptional regulator with XRE-family HTH domain
MATSDEQIGRNVARLRGEMSQKELASKMRARGWKWSQATLWAVEKGERPLRLTESEDLAEVLGVPSSLLRYPDAHSDVMERVRESGRAARDLEVAVRVLRESNAELALAAAKRRDEIAGTHMDELVRSTLAGGAFEHVASAQEDQNDSPPGPETSDDYWSLHRATWARRWEPIDGKR